MKYREQRRAACPAGSKIRRRDMPEINDKLKERRIDVAWNLTYKLKSGAKVTNVFWCPGTIAAVSTVETTGEDGKTLGTGWIFVKYDDKSSGWLLATRPTFWNATKAGAWRWWKGDEDETRATAIRTTRAWFATTWSRATTATTASRATTATWTPSELFVICAVCFVCMFCVFLCVLCV